MPHCCSRLSMSTPAASATYCPTSCTLPWAPTLMSSAMTKALTSENWASISSIGLSRLSSSTSPEKAPPATMAESVYVGSPTAFLYTSLLSKADASNVSLSAVIGNPISSATCHVLLRSMVSYAFIRSINTAADSRPLCLAASSSTVCIHTARAAPFFPPIQL